MPPPPWSWRRLIDYHSYTVSAGGFSASSQVIPISVFGNYHFRYT